MNKDDPFKAPEGSHWEHLDNIHNLVRDADRELMCDFCSTGDKPIWRYRCDAFRIATEINHQEKMILDIGAVDDWAACEICSKLVDEGRKGKMSSRNALIERSVDSFKAKTNSNTPRIVALASVAVAHGKFFQFVFGEKEPLS